MLSKKYVIDAAERLGWTMAAAGVGTAITYSMSLPYAWGPILTVGLTALKLLAARHIGNPESAAIPGGEKTPRAAEMAQLMGVQMTPRETPASPTNGVSA